MNIKQCLISARMAITRGWKKYGKRWLRMAAPPVVVAGYQDQLEKILTLSDLPCYQDLQYINSDDSAEAMTTPEPDLSDIHAAATVEQAFEAAGYVAVRVQYKKLCCIIFSVKRNHLFISGMYTASM
jgi:hypothetical protein